MDKKRSLLKLGLKRQQSTCPGYKGIGDYHNGAYECEHVSPYTKSAGNVDASLMIILQDWSSDDFLSGPVDIDARDRGYTPRLPSNRNLAKLLKEHFGMELKETYTTNLFPFIKMGNMTGSIPQRDYLQAALEFALPQIQIVSPKLVVCLGLNTYNAIRKADGYEAIKPLAAAITSPFCLYSSLVWCQAHPGARGQNNRNAGDRGRVAKDWECMAASLGDRV
jgi:uracil-DNA glycosylase